MKETFHELINYIKNPVLEKDENSSLKYRFQKFFKLFLLCVTIGFLSMPLFTLFEELGWVNLENHKVEEIFKGKSIFLILFLGGISIPAIEELIFRAPITLFKKTLSFKIAFYAFTFIFGLVHITNFDITPAVLILTPFLVIPQLFAGLSLGFLRVRFGLHWSILLHCVYNSFFILLSTFSES